MVESISSLRRKRTLRVNLIKNRYKEYKEEEDEDVEKTGALLFAIEESYTFVATIGTQISADIEDDDIDVEQTTAFDLLCYFQEITRKLKKILKRVTAETDADSRSSIYSGGENGAFHTKLPSLQLPTFNGDILQYVAFRERFEAVNARQDLADVEKLSYLIGLVSGPALELLNGLSICQKNYKPALEILHKEFGDVQKVRIAHVNHILKLRRPDATAVGLRDFTLQIMKSLRQLQAVEFECKSPEVECILTQVILHKIPEELKVRTNMYLHPEKKSLTVEKVIEIIKRISEEIVDEPKQKYHERSHERSRREPWKRTKNDEFTTAAVIGTIRDKRCELCNGGHGYWQCQRYKTKEQKTQRARELNACLKCYKPGHRVKECKRLVCAGCGIPGHAVEKCFRGTGNKTEATRVQRDIPQSQEVHSVHTVIQSVNSSVSGQSVALPLATVEIINGKKRQVVNVLFDQGAQRSFVKRDIADKMNLETVTTVNMTIDGFVTQGSRQGYKIVAVPVWTGSETIEINAAVIDKLPERIQVTGLTKRLQNMKRLGYKIANGNNSDNCMIELLIGCDHYYSFIDGNEIGGMPAIHSKLGWIPVGNMESKNVDETCSTNTVAMLHIGENSTPDDLSFLWKLDSIGISENEIHPEDKEAIKNFEKNITFDGKMYTVKLPWKLDPAVLPRNYELARGRLNSNLNRMRKDKSILMAYNDVIQNQLKDDFIEIVPEECVETNHAHYLSHHGVIKEDSLTTPLRIVFNCSQKGPQNAPSLNDAIFRGPNLLPEITQLLLRFRLNKFVVIADIKKAFLNVGLHEDDRNYTRFLWPKDPTNPKSELMTLRYKTVLFGSSASQYLLNAVIKHHLEGLPESTTAKNLARNTYVDNLMCSTNDQAELHEFYEEATEIMNKAHLPLAGWTSNDTEVLGKIPEKDCERRQEVSVLGMKWNLERDSIRLNSCEIEVTELTKRKVLKGLASQYDPIGLVSPVLLKGKLFVRQLCQQNLEWDTKLSDEDSEKWREIAAEFKRLYTIEFPRSTLITGRVTIHAYSDASSKAYGAVVYGVQGGKTALLIAKSKIAPQGVLTIPKLELTAVVLSARLINYVEETFLKEFHIDEIHIYSDSQVALGWINSAKSLPTYIQNRVDEIKKRVPNAVVHYVNTKENPSDVLSRGCTAKQLQENKLWLNGPESLTDPCKPAGYKIKIGECLAVNAATTQQPEDGGSHLLHRLLRNNSTLQQAIRLTAWLLRVKYKENKYHKMLDAEDLNRARLTLIKLAQNEVFAEELKHCKDSAGKRPPEMVTALNLQLENGMLTSVSRLEHADITDRAKRPYLLPSKHRLTSLIIADEHEKICHSGMNATIVQIRQSYYIPRIKQRVKSFIKTCLTCRREHGKAYPQPAMPALPSYRVNQTNPFAITGVDYGGPILTKEGKEINKRYICLFTCAVTRAVHLEIARDLSADAFLKAFERFTSRRGFPEHMLSDNATNFQNASRVITESQEQEVQQQVQDKIKCKWTFIPARAPWFGGIWERVIKTTKSLLRKILGKALVNDEELATIMCRIEAAINDRPLTQLADNGIVMEEPLTPSILLCGHRINTGPSKLIELDDITDPTMYNNENLTKRQKYLRYILQKYWDVWQKEYLMTLNRNRQGKNTTVIPQIGHVVIIHDDGPKLKWKVGKIVEVLHSKDGLIRTAKVKTKYGILCRPIIKLYPIETTGETLASGNTPGSGDTTGTRETTEIIESREDMKRMDRTSSEEQPESDAQLPSNRSRRVAAIKAKIKISDTFSSEGECRNF